MPDHRIKPSLFEQRPLNGAWIAAHVLGKISCNIPEFAVMAERGSMPVISILPLPTALRAVGGRWRKGTPGRFRHSVSVAVVLNRAASTAARTTLSTTKERSA